MCEDGLFNESEPVKTDISDDRPEPTECLTRPTSPVTFQENI